MCKRTYLRRLILQEGWKSVLTLFWGTLCLCRRLQEMMWRQPIPIQWPWIRIQKVSPEFRITSKDQFFRKNQGHSWLSSLLGVCLFDRLPDFMIRILSFRDRTWRHCNVISGIWNLDFQIPASCFHFQFPFWFRIQFLFCYL